MSLSGGTINLSDRKELDEADLATPLGQYITSKAEREHARRMAILDDLIAKLKSEVIQFDQLQANAALVAFGRFGKGMGHRAQLNLGDCAVYALAQSRAEPILALGRDFPATDLTIVDF